MNRLTFSVLLFGLVALACGRDDAGIDSSATHVPESPAAARMESGVQVADMMIDGDAFRPTTIFLRASTPARLVITRTDSPTCADSIKAPELGIEPTALPVGVPVAVAFTPPTEGQFTLACGMDMLTARIVVQT